MFHKKIYWSLKSIPELKDVPPKQRWKAWFACAKKPSQHWQVRLAFYLTILIPSSISLLLLIIFDNVYIYIAVFCVLFTPAIMILNQIQCEAIRPYLKNYIEGKRDMEEGEGKTTKYWESRIIIAVLIVQILVLSWQIYNYIIWGQEIRGQADIYNLIPLEEKLNETYFFRAIEVPFYFFFGSINLGIMIFICRPTKLGGVLILTIVIGYVLTMIMRYRYDSWVFN